MHPKIEKAEQQLDSLNYAERKEGLRQLGELAPSGEIEFPAAGTAVNLHLHSFYSYNTHGYSPTKIAYLARKTGLAAAALVDFDTLDGLEEFLDAANILGLKAAAGLETRVFVPEFSDKVINSPEEPGIAYHIGLGFPTAALGKKLTEFSRRLRKIARQRNYDLIQRVNKYLSPVELDYDEDVLPLTPAGNATERHICLAYARQAASAFNPDEELAKFWLKKLGDTLNPSDRPEGRALLNLIRQKTMKRGGVGYVQPEAGSFPEMEEVNRFILAAGGIPTLAWLDGTSAAEQDIEGLLKVGMSTGVAAINIIPARNFTPGQGIKDRRCRELYRIVELSEKMHLPVIVGTEMNSPGQKFVDDFKSAELAPLAPVFLKGAHIVYAHSALRRQCGLGYTGPWSEKTFSGLTAKNEFFEKLGALLCPQKEKLLAARPQAISPQQILDKIRSS